MHQSWDKYSIVQGFGQLFQTLDYLESFVHYPCTRQQVRRALKEWISQSSRKSLHVPEDEALRLLVHLLVYGHVRDVLNGQVVVTVPADPPKDATAQPSLWDESGEA